MNLRLAMLERSQVTDAAGGVSPDAIFAHRFENRTGQNFLKRRVMQAIAAIRKAERSKDRSIFMTAILRNEQESMLRMHKDWRPFWEIGR